MAKPLFLTQEAYEGLIDSGRSLKGMMISNEQELIMNMFARHWKKELAGLGPDEQYKIFYSKLLELRRKMTNLG